MPVSATWKTNYACFEFELVQDEDIGDQLERVARFIRSKETVLRAAIEPDGRAEIYLFIAPAAAIGFVLKPRVLKALADCGVGLGVDISLAKPD